MQHNILEIPRVLLSGFSKVSLQKTSFLASFAFSIFSGVTGVAHAQSITPAADGTGTVVNIDGTTYTIEGGALSGDGRNLFHSFESFGLTQQEIANFLSNPEIRNILGRVSGGTPSQINGLLQVSGGVSNLYLMNPAGIVFGPNAQLNVPGSFAAVTANSVDFAAGEFSAFGDVDYQALVGTPQGFSFAAETSGAIVNTGDLAVAPGSDLILLGDTVVNTGTLTAPGGTITVAAIPETQQIRISQDGMVLGLAMNADALSQVPADQPIAASLPELVTGGSAEIASTIQVDEQGRVWLTGSQIMIPDEPGTVIASGEIDAASDMTPGGTVQVLGEQVALLDATIDASGTSGGDVFIGGDLQGGGDLPIAQYTFIDDSSVIRADALINGDGGQVIVWADDTTQFAGEISARGGNITGDGGFVEVSGRDNLQFFGSADTNAPNGRSGTLLLDPTDIIIAAGGPDTGFNGEVFAADPGPTTIFQNQLQALDGDTNIIIQASNNITFEPLDQSGAAPIGIGGGGFIPTPSNPISGITFQPGSGSITFEAGGSLTMADGDSLDPNGRDLTITAGSISIGDILNFDSIQNQSGSIALNATNGGITAGRLSTGPDLQEGFDTSGAPSSISISANGGDVTVQSISTIAFTGTGGNVDINVTDGSFSTNAIETVFSGDVTVNADGISVGLIDAKPGGTISLNGSIAPDSTIRDISTSGSGTPGIGTPGIGTPGGSVTLIGNSGTIVNIGSTGSRIGSASSSDLAGIYNPALRRIFSSPNPGIQALIEGQAVFDNAFEDMVAFDTLGAARVAASDAAHTSWLADNLSDDVDSLLD